jgi:tetratricopeptide (TPR) repeat protein
MRSKLPKKPSGLILAIAWRNKGNALDGLARYDEAIQSYNKASSIDQTYSVSMIDMGNSHYNAGEYVAAIRYYDEAIKQDPKDEYAWYNKAMALRMLHRDSEAKAAYAKARELGYSGIMTLMEMTTR